MINYIFKILKLEEHYPKTLEKALMICSLCNNANIQKNLKTGQIEEIGDPTEVIFFNIHIYYIFRLHYN